MPYPLLENLQNLPGDEIVRLQKQLGVILRNSAEVDRLRSSLYNIYSGMGDPVHFIRKRRGSDIAVNSMLRLMDSFGTMHISHLDSTEREELKENPYTVWPDSETCMLTEEAMDVFESFDSFSTGYLFRHIRRLSAKEKKYWAKWIDLDLTPSTERMKNRLLYRRLAGLRFEDSGNISENSSKYLEDVFPDDPNRFQIAWYYREVLSLYDSLSRMEKENALNSRQSETLQLLKTGKLFVVREKAEFGKRALNRLVLAKENHSVKFTQPVQEPPVQEKRELLFQ